MVGWGFGKAVDFISRRGWGHCGEYMGGNIKRLSSCYRKIDLGARESMKPWNLQPYIVAGVHPNVSVHL